MNGVVKKLQPDLFHAQAIHGLTSFRDDVDLMSHPFSSIEKGRTEAMVLVDRTARAETRIKVTGADYGIATVWDNDILIYLRTQVAIAMNRGEAPTRRMRFNVYDLLRATKRGTGKTGYEAFRSALQRLKATTIITNISADGLTLDQGVNWINDYTFVSRTTAGGRIVMSACEIEVSEWTWQMMQQARRMLAIDQAYFEITGGLERKLYGILRRHLGQQSIWHIGLERLQELTGSSAPAKKFRYNMRRIVSEQSIPGFVLELTNDHRPPDVAKASPVPVSSRSGKEYLIVRPAPRALAPV